MKPQGFITKSLESEVTIYMALFKILKGPEAALPTTKKEGWAYVTNEGNFYVDISDTLRVKINSNADFSIKAENDSSNQKIVDTYIKDVIYNQSGTAPYYTLRLGNGNLKATNSVTDKVIIPVANTTDAGVVTIGEQTFAGAKTFNALITAKLGLTSNENISTAKQLISTIENGTAPLVVSSKTLVANLNADTVDGLHASNNLFNAENSSTTILPTQRAIWSSLNDLLVAAHALVYRGIIDPTDSKTHPTAGKVGDVYIISKEGTFAGVYCEPGDMAIYYASGWDIVQVNVNGAVVIKDGGAYNSAHTTTNAISRFEDTTGRVIKNSKVIIDDTGNMTPVDKNAQNLGSTENIWNTIYGSTFTGTSNQAISDDSGQVIKNTYIKEIAYVQNNSEKSNSKSKPYLKYLLGKGTDPIYLSMPLAGAQQGGIITAEAQEISGVKTLNAADGGLIIPKVDSFQYSGIQEDTITGTTKYIWFSTTDGIPKYNKGLAFNPSASIQWSNDSNKVTKAVLTVARLDGLALQALEDSQGKVIDDTYLQDVILNNDDSAPYYTLQLGNGSFKDTDEVSGSDRVIIPVASTTQAGVITADTSNAQTITGAKIIDSNGSLEVQKDDGFIFSGIQPASSAGERPVWFSRLSVSGTPSVNDSFKFNPNETLKIADWSNENSGTKSAVLHVPHIDGLAYKALRDSQGLVIDDTYIKAIEFIVDNNTQAGSASNPYLKYTLGNGADITKIALPAASSTHGGILTLDQQDLMGLKTFWDGIRQSAKTPVDDVNYSIGYYTFGILQGRAVASPLNLGGLTYNPSTKTLNADNFSGLAAKATADAKNQVIAETYIKNISYADHRFTITLGDGTPATNSPIEPLFAASSSCGGAATRAENGIFYVDGSSSTTAGTWIGTNTNIAALTQGLTIAYKIGVAGSSTTTLTLTIASGTTAAITVKRNTGNLQTHLPVGTVVLLTYDGTNWCWADYDSNTTGLRVFRKTTEYNGDYPILVSSYSLSNIGMAGTNGSYSVVDGVIGQDGKYTPTINPYTGVVKIKATTASTSTTTGALIVSGGIGAAGNIYGSKVYNAVWNDYAEFRKAETLEPGRVVIEDASGEMKLSSERLQPGASIISDTFGSAMGETEECKTPIAVAGRVLTYYHGDINMYTVGAAVGTGPNGTVSLMTREEIMTYPDRIVGIVSEIPSYEEWGPEHIKVNGRIWIKIK